ncbi:MAG TPA: nucleotidyltransferase domain-containing protein [Verrucomicrobiota bacterium]|nr:nucleotidyltransferase domain-containing protein [Verrucomicrobiota bacterium]
MIRKKETSLLKTEILKCLDKSGVKVSRIILFGSRAKGNYSKFSDYDFLIITKQTLPIEQKMEIAKEIRIALAQLHIASDIIINSEEEVELKKNKIGYVTRYAIKEGVTI